MMEMLIIKRRVRQFVRGSGNIDAPHYVETYLTLQKWQALSITVDELDDDVETLSGPACALGGLSNM